MSKVEWCDVEKAWGGGGVLLLGKWKVGHVYYDPLQSKDSNKYAAGCDLPGIKKILGHYGSDKEARGRVERAVSRWIVEAGFTGGDA